MDNLSNCLTYAPKQIHVTLTGFKPLSSAKQEAGFKRGRHENGANADKHATSLFSFLSLLLT